MPSILELFEDEKARRKIEKRLPYLFHKAKEQVSRGGKEGMEVGTLREQILIAMLIHRFGRENIQIPGVTDKDRDVLVFGEGVSIKTAKKSGSGSLPYLKLFWGSDQEKMENFVKTYQPVSHLLVALIKWDSTGPLAVIPLEVQKKVYEKYGKGFFHIPKSNTNHRGVALSKEALSEMLNDQNTKSIEIFWRVPEEESPEEAYRYWLDLWEWDREED